MERKIYFAVTSQNDLDDIRVNVNWIAMMHTASGRKVEKLSHGVFPGKKTPYVGWISYVTIAHKEAIMDYIRRRNWAPVEL